MPMCLSFSFGRVLPAALLGLALVPGWVAAGTGEQIYRQTCASCAGWGKVERTAEAARGDKTVAQLATDRQDHARRRPRDVRQRPGLEGRHAPARGVPARARTRPKKRPRGSSSRAGLTVRQYRNAVADLIQASRSTGRKVEDDRRGLRREYFNARGFRGDKPDHRPARSRGPGSTSAGPARRYEVRYRAVFDPLGGRFWSRELEAGRYGVHRPHEARRAAPQGQRQQPAPDRPPQVRVGQRHPSFRASIFLLGEATASAQLG